MKHRGSRPTQREQEDPNRQQGSVSDQRAMPGKRTLTMGLPGRSPTGSRAVQRHPVSTGEQRPTREPVEDWTLVATRPDLHQTPMLRPSRDVGMAAGPATGVVQMKKGGDQVSEGGGGDRERKKQSRRERDQRRGEMKPQEIEQGVGWLTLFAEGERLRRHEEDRQQHEMKDWAREQLLENIERREEELLDLAEALEWQEERPIFGREYRDSQRVLGNLNSAPEDMEGAYEHMMGVLTEWQKEMETFRAEEELRELRESVAQELAAPREVLEDIIAELGTEIPKGTRNGQALERDRKQHLKTAKELQKSCTDLLRNVRVGQSLTRPLSSLQRNLDDLEASVGEWIEKRDDALGGVRGSSRGTAQTITRTQVITQGIRTGHVHQDAVAELHRYLDRWHMYDDIEAIWDGRGEDRTAPGTTGVLHHHANGSYQHNLLYDGTVILGVVNGHMETVARTGVQKVEKKVMDRQGGPTVEVALTGDGVYRVVDG